MICSYHIPLLSEPSIPIYSAGGKKVPHGTSLLDIFDRITSIAPAMAAALASPDRHKWTRTAIKTPPCEDIAVGSLHDCKCVDGPVVDHGSCFFFFTGGCS